MLHLTHFAKQYGATTILKIDALSLPGEIFWVKGANGAGKSTLLRALAGILHAEGDVQCAGYSLKKNTVAYRRMVNFAEAEPLYPEFLTGMDMIDLFRTSKGGINGQDTYYIESMQMQSYIHQPLGTYSSGMLKKLSLVLAFLGTPRLILLDEPTITLDAQALRVWSRWVSEHHMQHGTAFLISSHQPVVLDGIVPQTLLIAHQTATLVA